MSKKKNIPENENAQKPTGSESDKERYVLSEKLQTFYNEAYINERDRLNAMFGRLDTYPVVEEKVIYKEADLSKYVPIEQYRKKKVAATVLGILFGAALIAAAVFAVLFFSK